METHKLIIACATFIIFCAFFFVYLEERDKQVEATANEYVACVQAEYHMHPSAYVAQYGVYPTCPTPRAHE